MPKFKITVEKITEKAGEKYPDKETIYEQTVEDLDLTAVISTVNKIRPGFEVVGTHIIPKPTFPRREKGGKKS